MKKTFIKWNEFFERQPNNMVVFRVTPKTKLTNSTNNKKLWKMLHKMHEIYEGKLIRVDFKRKKKLGIKISYREKDTIWSEVIFKCEEDKKKIEFYLAVSELLADQFKRIVESKIDVSMEKTDKCYVVPVKNTIVIDYKYLRHDIFSLDTNSQAQTTPISSIMQTVEGLENGDFVRLSLAAEVIPRKKWAALSEYAHEKVKQGKTPQRARMSAGRILKASNGVLSGVVNEVNNLIQDTLKALENSFFKGKGEAENKGKVLEQKLVYEIHETRLSNRTIDKRNLPCFRTHIRAAVHSKDKIRRELTANQLMGVYSEISENNEIQGIKIKFNGRKEQIIREMNTFQLSNKTKYNPDANIMSTDEIATLSKYPTRELQNIYQDELQVNKNIETDIPAIFSDEKGVFVGHAVENGKEIPISIPVKNPNEFFKGYTYQGAMGAGKDTAMQNFVVEGSLNHNISFVVIDQVNKEGREGLANGIRDSLPPEKIIDLDFSNEDYLPPLDLTEVMEKLGRRGADRFAAELIEFFGDVENMGQTKKLLREFAKASKGSLYNLQQLLYSEDLRIERIKELRAEGETRLAESLEEYVTEFEETVKYGKNGEEVKREVKMIKDGQRTLDRKAEAILNRLDDFLGDSTLYNIFSQPPKTEVNFEQWMKEGKVIICRVPDRILSTVAVRTLVHWITLKTLMTRLLMENDAQANGTFIIYNEPQTYMNSGLQKLMSRIAVQGRKERLGSIFAFHHIGQIPNQLAEDLKSGGCHYFLFKNDNKKVFEDVKDFLHPTIEIEDALNLKQYHAINILNFGGERQNAFVAKMLSPSYERYQAYDNSFLTLRHAKMYGRSWEEIDKILNEKKVI